MKIIKEVLDQHDCRGAIRRFLLRRAAISAGPTLRVGSQIECDCGNVLQLKETSPVHPAEWVRIP